MKSIVKRLCRKRSIPLSIRRKLAAPFIKRDSTEFAICVDGQEFHGRLDNYIEWVVYVTGQFFEFSYINLIKSIGLSGCALDIGANVGNHTLAYSAFFDEVVSLEPYTPIYDRLKEKADKLTNVITYNVAFGNQSGEIGFTPPRTSNFGTGRVDSEGELKVEIVRGDEFLPGKIGKIGFIKIDVEGHEFEVLKGLAHTLDNDLPAVLFEAPIAVRANGGQALLDSFKLFPIDYRFFGLKGQTSFPIQRQIAKAYPITQHNSGTRYTNILAIPPQIPFQI
ncbi:MAG: FkbM family methyltransferase [Planctomycetaceae bacterium]|mgnify:FL=1|nr:FkbM family methyltransferase [Planctomycetaceae bacterium]MBT4012598.1 FkbM family methyltransferase [Planctomycetaceae bacterium]MBT4724224.1 FkbM family methyltransferase [Planctomycetaceae bacterium]MBT4845901.1 FkbM family methyltransferase [Planctomycetaceae bacterium]MBT5124878.1 FkbM family methyltransferase [Planctomycetaceae bacterium]